jgi:hypothetical protein
VLVLSRARDAELGEVTRLLRKLGIRCARVNADELAQVDLLVDPGRRLVRLAGQWLAPTVTWIRHFSPRAIEAPAAEVLAAEVLAEPAGRLFVQDSWHAAADSLADVSGVTIGSGRPGLLAQLRLAASCGVRVPQTFVTTDPAQAAGLMSSGRVVVKALHQHFVEAAPGRLTGVFPVVIEPGSLPDGAEPGPPVIVQEYVEHQAELRVYYVAGQLHGFEISKRDPADLWLDSSRVAVTVVRLSQPVANAARTLATAFRLLYGAFDFLMCDGAPVFLEVNPDGDWRWIERKIGSAPVSEAAAQMLRDLHQARLPAAGAAGQPGPDSFSLLSFLAG